MKKYTLPNGITLIHEYRNSPSVVIQVMIKTGSNYEKDGIRGISHFIEHMLFEGTTKRENSKIIAAEIEDLGGEMNAYTTSDRTAYHIKILNKHVAKAIDVLSDMIQNPAFKQEYIDKEKKVILKEIHMALDEPRFYKWILFQKTLFKKHPAREPTYGTVNDVASITREKLLDYYSHYYQPQNMIISVVGGVKEVKSKIEKAFILKQTSKQSLVKHYTEPKQTKDHKAAEKKNTNSSYVVLGVQTCTRQHKDSYALDILEAIYGKGQSGRSFDIIRNKHGLAYEVGVNSDFGRDMGFFAIHASTDPKKAQFAQKLMIDELHRPVTEEEVKDAKSFIEGNHTLDNEDNADYADELCYWEYMKDAKVAKSYIKHIKKTAFTEALKAQKKYFMGKYAVAVVGPK